MNEFWKQSPEWQRKQEAEAAWEAAKQAEKKAAESVLARVRYDATRGEDWHRAAEAYTAAAEAAYKAVLVSIDADEAFHASPAGQARARYWKDPLFFCAAESEAA